VSHEPLQDAAGASLAQAQATVKVMVDGDAVEVDRDVAVAVATAAATVEAVAEAEEAEEEPRWQTASTLPTSLALSPIENGAPFRVTTGVTHMKNASASALEPIKAPQEKSPPQPQRISKPTLLKLLLRSCLPIITMEGQDGLQVLAGVPSQAAAVEEEAAATLD
jgi:post-segregation antitoxin (ccd killing protein)